MQKTAIIVHGPHGFGKSLSVEALKAHFGVSRVVDGWAPGDPVEADTLYLTNVSLVDEEGCGPIVLVKHAATGASEEPASLYCGQLRIGMFDAQAVAELLENRRHGCDER